MKSEKRKTILVVGGAGYIGSHMVHSLKASDQNVLVLDDFSTGHRGALKDVEFIEGSIGDKRLLKFIFATYRIDAVMHFASCIQVAESNIKPDLYYHNNLVNTLSLIDSMLAANITSLIFSSTAAVYGNPIYTPINEQHPKVPINTYGRSKWLTEQIMTDYSQALGLKYVSLRYFNAAGASPTLGTGERHDPETHLIPLLLQVASGRRSAISVYGSDYDTPDGTCIRDYIHVEDLCNAHLLALRYSLNGGQSENFNLGNGQGFSVHQVIGAARKITGRDIAIQHEARRLGDPAILVADSRKAKNLLGWQPKHTELDKIVQDAWDWEQMHPWST